MSSLKSTLTKLASKKRFLPCADYNIAKFECVKADKDITVASVCFHCEYLELFVTGNHPEIYQWCRRRGAGGGGATAPALLDMIAP